MSQATSAKDARERAAILMAYMRRNKSGIPFHGISRAASDCLEMGDGDQVVEIIKQHIADGRIERELVRKFLTLPS